MWPLWLCLGGKHRELVVSSHLLVEFVNDDIRTTRMIYHPTSSNVSTTSWY